MKLVSSLNLVVRQAGKNASRRILPSLQSLYGSNLQPRYRRRVPICIVVPLDRATAHGRFLSTSRSLLGKLNAAMLILDPRVIRGNDAQALKTNLLSSYSSNNLSQSVTHRLGHLMSLLMEQRERD